MRHLTILKEDEDPLQVFHITPCIGCAAGCHQSRKNFHCPICSPLKFKPKASLTVILKHLVEHFTVDSKVVRVAGYKITLCTQPCLEAQKKSTCSHFHCPLCPEIIQKRKEFLQHVTCHDPSSSMREDDKSGTQHGQNFIFSTVISEPARECDSVINPAKRITEKADICSLIVDFKDSGDSSYFENEFSNISKENDLSAKFLWIASMTEYASLLDKKADKLVLSFFKIQFFTSQQLAGATINFIRTLIGHHNYYAYYILKRLFQHLIPVVEEPHEELLVNAGSISKAEEATYDRVLSAIILINSDVPLTQDNLVLLARKSVPYFQSHVHKHAVYTRNLLLLASRLPHLRPAVLEVIITNMITIDVHAPRSELTEEEEEEDQAEASDDEDVFDIEIEDRGAKEASNSLKNSVEYDSPLDTCQVPRPMTHKTGNSLDVLMSIMLQYVHDVSHGIQKPRLPKHLQRNYGRVNVKMENDRCQPSYDCAMDFDPKRMGGCECGGSRHDIESLKLLYSEMKVIFSNVILRTHASSHVQFLLFYLLSLRPGLIPFFADFMIKKFKDPNSSLCIRKNSLAYVGSLLARGRHVSILDVQACLESIRDWCNGYLDAQEQLPERNYEDIMLHGAFYYACQTLFYVFTFRYKEYILNKKTLTLARNLNLDRFIHSRLNPLLVCSPGVVSNFAAVAQHYQIAYCYTVIENNKRLGIPIAKSDDIIETEKVLESFFPFDPYLLSRSKLYIQNHYREFEGLPEEIVNSECMEIDDEKPSSLITSDSYDTMYGISPGFVRFSNFEDNTFLSYN